MANAERGEVDLVCGEKTYTLFLSTEGLCVMEARTKKTFGQILGGIMTLDVTATREYLRAVLHTHHGKDIGTAAKKRGVDPDVLICELIDKAGMKATKDALVDLFKLNQPPEEEAPSEGGETRNPPDAEDGTGDSSTSTVAASA